MILSITKPDKKLRRGVASAEKYPEAVLIYWQKIFIFHYCTYVINSRFHTSISRRKLIPFRRKQYGRAIEAQFSYRKGNNLGAFVIRNIVSVVSFHLPPTAVVPRRMGCRGTEVRCCCRFAHVELESIHTFRRFRSHILVNTNKKSLLVDRNDVHTRTNLDWTGNPSK